jgi:hypothetical protein
MTANEFLTRTFTAADDAALRLAGVPSHLQNAWLDVFAGRVRAQWGEIFSSYLSVEDVDAIVAYLLGHVRAKIERLQRFGAGNA